LEIFQQFPTNRDGQILKQVRHALSFAPATLVSEAKIETGALIKTGARPCVEFWSSHSCECDKAVRTYSYY